MEHHQHRRHLLGNKIGKRQNADSQSSQNGIRIAEPARFCGKMPFVKLFAWKTTERQKNGDHQSAQQQNVVCSEIQKGETTWCLIWIALQLAHCQQGQLLRPLLHV